MKPMPIGHQPNTRNRATKTEVGTLQQTRISTRILRIEAIRLLLEAKKPLRCRDLVERLNERNIVVRGVRPPRTLKSALYKLPDIFMSFGHKGFWLIPFPLPQEGYRAHRSRYYLNKLRRFLGPDIDTSLFELMEAQVYAGEAR
jgi:hypothetical protein